MGLSDKYEPCPEEWMNSENPRFTICEALRTIYRLNEGNKETQMLCRIDMTMAKKMNSKLMEYNAKWQEIFDGNTETIKSRIGRQ